MRSIVLIALTIGTTGHLLGCQHYLIAFASPMKASSLLDHPPPPLRDTSPGLSPEGEPFRAVTELESGSPREGGLA
jgi:hypothetical protein